MMRTSESIQKISAALAKALPEIQNATKDASNPAYRSAYATLNSVMEAVKPVLFEHGVVVVQGPGWRDGIVTVTTRFLHESGEWIETEAGAPVAHRWEKVDGTVTDKGPDAQTTGSAISYLRRYSLAAMAGITQEDDDGNAASGAGRDADGQSRSAPRQASKPATGQQAAASDVPPCPVCKGAMWDNRDDAQAGVNGGRRPDLKCKDKECDTAIWIDGLAKEVRAMTEQAIQADVITPEEAAQIMRVAVDTKNPAKLLASKGGLEEKMLAGMGSP